MSQEEDTPARVTRGALRRRSIDQDTSAGPGTPKKAVTSKKLAVLDAIQEGNNGPVDLTGTDDDSSSTRSTRVKKDTPMVALKGNRRSRTASLTEENLASLDASEMRRTPRRRPSQDVVLTPQTAPQPGRRVTRRNSVTSDDASLHSLPVTTPKGTKSRLSVAPPTIAEDDEKEEKANSSNLEAEMSDLDIRKLRNRSISNSPVPRGSPSGKNTSIGSQRTDEEVSPAKQAKVLLEDISETDQSQKTETTEVAASAMQASPMKQAKVLLVDVAGDELPQKSSDASIVVMESLSVSQSNQNMQETTPAVETTPTKGRKSVSSMSGSAQKLLKNVTFEETPDRQNPNTYPKTPIAMSGGKRFKFDEPAPEQNAETKVKSTPEMFEIDETVNESPKEEEQAPGSESKPQQTPQKQTPNKPTPKKQTPHKETPQKQTPHKQTPHKETPQKQMSSEADQLDKSVDASLAHIVEDVRENINQVDLSMSILGTPKPTEKQKSHFSRLREGSSSTPIVATTPKKEQAGSPKFVSNTPDGRGSQKKKDPTDESKHSKSWSQAVKGSANDKGIDLFSVRKQEEEIRQDEEAKQLNESLKRKSLEKGKSPKKAVSDDEEEDEDDVSASELLGSDSAEHNSFLDDEAMEVADYESGDSLDSEARAEMEDNEVRVEGESIGSQDSEHNSDDNDEEDGDEEEDEEDDSFIASDDEEAELLEGTDDDLGSEEEDKKSSKKKRKRIIQQDDSSEDEKEVSGKNKSVVSLDRTTTASEGNVSKFNSSSEVLKAKTPEKSPKKSMSPSNTPKPKTPKSQPNPTPEKTPKKTPSKSPAKTPVQASKSEQDGTKSLSTPGKSPKSKNTTIVAEEAEENDEEVASKSSRKSMPAAVLVSADFYTSSAKKAKRNTIGAMTNGDADPVEQPSKQEGKHKSSNLVTNPAALALAKKNKRLSLDPVATPGKADKRASLPGKIPEDKPVQSPLKKKIVEEEETPVEAMDVDEQPAESSPKKTKESPKPKPLKKKPKDLLDYDHDAILSRCNEIVRADKEKRKESASLRQKKKDEKRRQREQQEQEEQAENGDESLEHQKKKKKKKNKKINYLLEELGETKEEQLAKALKRKQALLEVKRERKKLKKAAKLQQVLNKENQQGEGKSGIGAKFDKKAKKKAALVEELAKAEVVEPKPIVKRAVSAFAVYRAEIEALKQQSLEKKKGKQLKEKNQQRSAADEVKDALQAEPTQKKKEKKVVNGTESEPKPVAEKKTETSVPVPAVDESKEKVKKEKKNEHVEKVSKKDSNEDLQKKAKIAYKEPAIIPEEPKPKKKKLDQANSVPIQSTISLDEELAKLKQSLSEPITKVVKKQKLSQKESVAVNFSEVEQTPPRKTTGGKLKALARLESGFIEEPTTPEHQQLKRNRGFKEEPVTPKAVGFRVSHILPAGQEELLRHAVAEKKKKKYVNSNRIQLEDVKEPVKGLPLPIWTRSGTFEVEEVAGKGGQKKSAKKAKAAGSDYIPLGVNGTGSGKSSTEFLLKSLEAKQAAGKNKAHRVDLATVDESVLNFKKQAIFGKSSHLREKKPKH